MAIMATAILSQDRDRYFQIQNASSRRLNIDAFLPECDAIVLEGESAFKLSPESGKTWLQTIHNADNTASITKKYTVKVKGYSDFYLLQFDTNEFYLGLVTFPEWLGLNPANYLRYLHDGNNYLVFLLEYSTSIRTNIIN